MNKAGVTKTPKSPTSQSGQQFDMDVLAAKSKFFAVTIGMGWRLALTVLIPLIAGIKIDQRFNSSPSYTLAGFMLAVAGGAVVVWDSVKQVNQEQAEEEQAEAVAKAAANKRGNKK